MKHTVSLIIVAFLAGLAGAWVFSSFVAGKGPAGEAASVKESAFDRVMRTQTLRCGYGVWAPAIIKDANSGKLSGITYDYVEALGEALHLKVVWAEEVGWGDFPAALKSGRIDAFCIGVWPNAARARQADFVTPITYQPSYAFVRADDKRFDNNLEALNNPSVTAAVQDGDSSAAIAAADFPKAKTLQIAQLAHWSELFINIAAGKADVTFTDPASFAEYDAGNPGKIRRVIAKAPLRVFGNSIALAQGEDKLRRMLDTATQELLSSRKAEKIVARYEQYPGTFLRPVAPYQTTPEGR
ncbi:MAG: transporter substrate-binding domain-containing protein [Alphaproteobacteria bacterium]|nr:transporter substrate-binding domain-containing protein [Alphaproteobacteria bacterium]